MARTLSTVIVAFGLLSTCGCLFPYCAYPKLDSTPAVELDGKDSDVHAFRVDISRRSHDVGRFEPTVVESLAEIPVSHDERIPSQFKPSATYGFVILGVALNYRTRHSESLALRIYRPGYETVEIRTWERVNKVAWTPAPLLEAQEAELDKLLGHTKEPRSDANRKALEFIAGEYERIAAATRDAEQRKRIEEKAAKLRELNETGTRIAK